MMQIYLCEDDPMQLKIFSLYVKKYLTFHNFNQKLACATTDPHLLLKKLERSKEVGLYFLDIDLQTDMDGLELAQKIRSYDPRGYIVFITSHQEKALLTFSYKVEALDFIAKEEPDKLPERIYQCMASADENEKTVQRQDNNLITLKVEQEMIILNQSDIIFIESDPMPHKLVIHMPDGVQRISLSFKELEALLDFRFFRCHNSILANLEHAVSYQPQTRRMLMDNGETCPVAVRLQHALKSRLKA